MVDNVLSNFLKEVYPLLKFDPKVESRKRTTEAIVNHYIVDHWPRMIRTLDMLEKEDIRGVASYDVGSWIPFIGYHYYKKQGMFAHACSIDIQNWEMEGAAHHQLDICKTHFQGKFGLVICQEVLEHLPCNLYNVLENIVGMTDRHICISVPIGSTGKNRSKKLDITDSTNRSFAHIREFKDGELHGMMAEVAPNFLRKGVDYVACPVYNRMEISVYERK